jgi:MFS family permease
MDAIANSRAVASCQALYVYRSMRAGDTTEIDIASTRGGGTAAIVVALGTTQLIGWGTTYYLPAILGQSMARDLGLSGAQVFSGIAITLIAAALLAWPMGRMMDRNGAGRTMPAGSMFLALGLLVLGNAQGFATYALAWLIFGIGMALAMSNAALSAIAQVAGPRARRGIVVVMLFGGMAATVFWPLTLWLEGLVGWRACCFVYAGAHMVVCAPLHAFYLARATRAEHRRDSDADVAEGSVPASRRRLAAGLIVIAVGLNGIVSWGLDLHLIRILQEFGLSAVAAVAVAALKGPATLLARAMELIAPRRVTPVGSALAAGLLMPIGLILPLTSASGLLSALVFVSVYSFGTGLMTVARATLPLTLLGAQGYASTIGLLTLPTQICFAVSPMVFGWLLDAGGLTLTLSISLGGSLAACAALLALSRLPQPHA